MFDWLAEILGYVMYGCMWLVNDNYVIALLLFALVMQILLCPFGIKQQKNMIKQAAIRPLEMAIRKKYAGRNDQVTMRKMQNELLELQQKNGFSPMAGCLPMIVQMIIIFPLYWVVIRPLQYCGGLSYSTCYKLAQIFGLEFGKNAAGELTQPASTTFQVDLATKLSQDGWRETIQNSESLLDSDGVNVLEAVEKMMERFGGDVPNATLFGVDLGVTPFDSLKRIRFNRRYHFESPFLLFSIIPYFHSKFSFFSQYFSRKIRFLFLQIGNYVL